MFPVAAALPLFLDLDVRAVRLLPATYVSTSVSRSEPASTTVVTRLGSPELPEPVTPLWLTGVNGVVVPRLAPAAVDPWLLMSGAKSVPPVATNVPQSPGVVDDGYSSNAASPE